tara:strand:- start:456 stop:617 length:162 start_codon:yes stop_codon:yes gene_type:complete
MMNKLNLVLGSLMMMGAVGAIETGSMPLSTAMVFGVIGSIAAVYSAYKLNEEY